MRQIIFFIFLFNFAITVFAQQSQGADDRIEVFQPSECGKEGKVVFDYPSAGWILTITIYNLQTGLSSNYTPSQAPHEYTLPTGNYILNYTYSDGMGGNFNIETTIGIGAQIEWDLNSSINQLTTTPSGLLTNPIGSNGVTESYTTLSKNSSDWMVFKTEFIQHPNPQTSYPKYCTVRLIDDANSAQIGKVTVTNPGITIYGRSVEYFDANNVLINTVNIPYNHRDQIRFIVDGTAGGSVKVYVNAQLITSFPTSTVSGSIGFVGETGPYSELTEMYTSYCPSDFIAKTQKVLFGSYYLLEQNVLKFQYSGEYNISDLDFEFTNEMGLPVSNQIYSIEKIAQLGSIEKKNADNRYILTEDGNLPSGFYMLKITNPKHEEEFIRIRKE